MTTHRAQTRIAAPKNVVWEALADIGGAWKYNPTVTSSHSLTEANSGLGAERHCDLVFPGASVTERVVEWDDTGSYTIEVFGGEKMPPIKNVRAYLAVTEDGPDASVVTASMVYDTKFGPIGWLMDRFMVSKKFGQAFAGIFAGLKHHIETGEVIEAGVEVSHDAVHYSAV